MNEILGGSARRFDAKTPDVHVRSPFIRVAW